jgi:hypothetical protein
MEKIQIRLTTSVPHDVEVAEDKRRAPNASETTETMTTTILTGLARNVTIKIGLSIPMGRIWGMSIKPGCDVGLLTHPNPYILDRVILVDSLSS